MVQHIPFIAVPVSSPSNNNNQDPSSEGIRAEAGIFEGHELQELAPSYKIQLLLALQEAVSFQEASCPIGECRYEPISCWYLAVYILYLLIFAIHRESLANAVGALFDAFPSDNAGLPPSDEFLPKVMLGPTIEAIVNWLTGQRIGGNFDESGVYTDGSTGFSTSPSAVVSRYNDADHFEPTPSGDLVSLFSNLTLGLWSSVVGKPVAPVTPTVGTNASFRNNLTTVGSPAEACMGVVIHLFVDSAQVRFLVILLNENRCCLVEVLTCHSFLLYCVGSSPGFSSKCW